MVEQGERVKEAEYLTPRQLSDKLGVSLKAVVKWTQARRIQGQTKVGRLWRYRVNEVEKALLSGNFLGK